MARKSKAITAASEQAATAGKSGPRKERRSKEPPSEKFRSLEDLMAEFQERRAASGFRSLEDFKGSAPMAPPSTAHSDKATRAEGQPSGIGTLKKVFEGRGFGFITPDEDPSGAGDIFLHFSDLTSGGGRCLGVGMRVRYDAEPDAASGRLRAKNVVPILREEATSALQPSISESSDEEEDEHTDGVPRHPDVAYDRKVFLNVFEALRHSSTLRHSEKPACMKLCTVSIPEQVRQKRDVEDPNLDDEHLIARLEARLDEETGADELNMETFGTDSSSWSFEEALKANENIKRAQEFEESTAAAGSGVSSDGPASDEESVDCPRRPLPVFQ